MNRYKNLNSNSGITHYQIRNQSIKVKFQNSYIYSYSYSSAGSLHVENMKELANKGKGLNTYIKRFVNYSYDR